MDGRRFDRIAKSLASQTSRRAVVRTISAGLAGGALGVFRRFGARDAGAMFLGEACATTKDCSGLRGVVCCGADAATGKKGTCVNIDNDPKNCGDCGITCPDDRLFCRPFLGKGGCCSKEGGPCERFTDCCIIRNQLCCEGICVFGEDASANCGVCGRACKAHESCCNFECVDLQRDATHCGTCKYICPDEKPTCCAGNCTDTKRDSQHCGGCGKKCRTPYEYCQDGKCVKAKQTSAPGKTVPNLAYAALQPSDLGSGYQLERGQMAYAPAALANAGFSPDLIGALSPGFQTAYIMAYQRPDDSGAVESSVSVMRAFYESDAAALAAVETMFFSHASFQADLTGNFPMGDKGYTLLFEQPSLDNPDVMVPVLETGMYVGPMLSVVATIGVAASLDGNVHPDVVRLEEIFARLVAAGPPPDDDDFDGPGLAPLALQISGVPEANLFPARIGGKDIRSVGQTSETRANVKVAHGDATDVWLNNFTLPDSPYRIFNRIWAFDSAESATAFGAQMPGPLMPTYESVGIELLDGKGDQLVGDQVSYDFTWPQPDGAWLGYQVLFPLDRFYFSVSVADVAGPSDVPLLLRANLVMLSLEEIIRRYLEQLAEAVGKALPFNLLPQIKPNPLIRGQEPETDEQKRADINSPWSYERGAQVDAHLLIQGTAIDRGEKPEVLPCDSAYVVRSFSEDRTFRNCDGYGGPKDRDNDVCKTAATNAAKMAATIPCPKEDCTAREETEIWRGWRCFEDEPEKGAYTATCAVELKIVCNRDVRP